MLFGPPFFLLPKFYHPIPPSFSHNRPGLSLWQVPPISFLYLLHTSLSPSYRPGLSLWQVPPILSYYLSHTSLSFSLSLSLLQARLVIVAGPAYLLLSSLHFSLSLSFIGVEKETLPKGTRAEAAPLPCENHVRELRTFFTLSQSHASNVHFFCETLSLPQDFQ